MTARTLTDADVDAIAERVAEKLRTPPRRRLKRARRVASAEAHERVARMMVRKGIPR